MVELTREDTELLNLRESRIVATTALHRQVLMVVVARAGREYAAYIFPVPGQDHSTERDLWSTEGVKTSREIAHAALGGACERLEKIGLSWVR